MAKVRSRFGMTRAEFDRSVENAIAHFDFRSVRRAMRVLKWRWACSTKSRALALYYPDIAKMKASIRSKADILWKMPGADSIGGGGFWVRVSTRSVFVSFVVAEEAGYPVVDE